MNAESEERNDDPAPRRIDPPLLLITVLLVLAVAAFFTVRPWRRSQVAWGSDLSAALVEARKSGRPVFVEVYAEWCGPCKQMERDTFSEADVGRALAPLNPVRLDDDKADVQRQMAAWGAMALPTHLLIEPNGRVHAQTLGYMPPPEFLEWLRRGTGSGL